MKWNFQFRIFSATENYETCCGNIKYAVRNICFLTYFHIFYVKMPDERIIIESQKYLWVRKYTLFLTN